MASTLNDRKVVAVAQVEKMGEKLIIPDKMTTRQAIDTLTRFEQAQEEIVNVVRQYDAFPWDGAVALEKVLTDKYGWANLQGNWFSSATLMPVEVGYKKTVQVPWGEFTLPGIDGRLATGINDKRGRKVFQVVASIKRKFEAEVQALFDQIGAYLEEHSIYRGQAIEIDFDQLNGENGLVEPKFINVAVDPDSLILNETVREDVENVIFTPISRNEELKRHGIPFRSAVVLAGPFGTGKTMTMTVAAYYAVKANVFYLKVKRASQLSKAIEFARMYENPNGAVVSVEDIDRVTAGERTVAMDDLLNTIDGVDSKTSKIMVLMTTNAVENINPALLRNGRVRKVIVIDAPDAASVAKLIRHYGQEVIAPDADLSEASEILAGTIPATIADVVALSKLAMLKRVPAGSRRQLLVDGKALASAAKTMKVQLGLVNRSTDKPTVPTLDAALRQTIGEAFREPLPFKVVSLDSGTRISGDWNKGKVVVGANGHSE
jgi:transitional endoplasmic reticulum ATPase